VFWCVPRGAAPVTAAALRYVVENSPEAPLSEREVCFYGDLTRRVWHVLGFPRIAAYI
jgi:hypothetical protein